MDPHSFFADPDPAVFKLKSVTPNTRVLIYGTRAANYTFRTETWNAWSGARNNAYRDARWRTSKWNAGQRKIRHISEDNIKKTYHTIRCTWLQRGDWQNEVSWPSTLKTFIKQQIAWFKSHTCFSWHCPHKVIATVIGRKHVPLGLIESAVFHRKKDLYRREGKGRRCCLGDIINSILC